MTAILKQGHHRPLDRRYNLLSFSLSHGDTVYLSLCLFDLSICLCLSVPRSLCLSLSLSVPRCLSVSLSLCLSVSLSYGRRFYEVRCSNVYCQGMSVINYLFKSFHFHRIFTHFRYYFPVLIKSILFIVCFDKLILVFPL